MRSKYVLSAIFGAAVLSSLASTQAPGYGSYGSQPTGSCYEQSGGLIYTRFPIDDGFPNITQGTDPGINLAKRADGIPPNTQLPNSLSLDTVASIRLSMQLEYYAVAFFTQLLNYITENKPGFNLQDSEERAYALRQLDSQRAQAEQHSLTSTNLLVSFGLAPEQPCQYQLPPGTSNDYTSYIFVAAFLTDLYLAAAAIAAQRSAIAGDTQILVNFLANDQNIAQRAGVLRMLSDLTPAASPFPTVISRDGVYSYLLNYLIVPGSCPSASLIGLQYSPPVTIVQNLLPCGDVDQVAQFSVRGTDVQAVSGYYVAYGNQLNLPVVLPVMNVRSVEGCVEFEALFPCSLPTFGSGLTGVAILNNSGPFNSVEDVNPYKVYGINAFYLS